MFYTAVRTEWPSNYVSIDADYGVIINRSFLRYALFTLGPTYLVSLFATTLCNRFGGHGVGCGVLIAIVHVIKNNGRHAFLVMRYRHDQARYPLLIVDVFNIGVVFVAALAGAVGPGPFPDIVPSASDFFSSLWTTAFVAVVAICLLYATKNRTTLDKLLQRSQAETRDLTPIALSLAGKHGTDPALVLAIMYAENLQRPHWVRTLERIKGKIWPAGSYGVMQISSNRPLSDLESVHKAVTERLSGKSVPHGEYSYDYEELENTLREWNDNDEFVTLARQLYGYLDSEYNLNTAEATPPDDSESGAGQAVSPGATPESEPLEELETRAQLAVTLRMLARSINDDRALARISSTLSLDALQRLVGAVSAVTFSPTDDDMRFGNELYQALSMQHSPSPDPSAGATSAVEDNGVAGADEPDR
jgi:hypothetical protein